MTNQSCSIILDLPHRHPASRASLFSSFSLLFIMYIHPSSITLGLDPQPTPCIYPPSQLCATIVVVFKIKYIHNTICTTNLLIHQHQAQYTIASSKRPLNCSFSSSTSSLNPGANISTLFCGSVPSTNVSISPTSNPNAFKPLG